MPCGCSSLAPWNQDTLSEAPSTILALHLGRGHRSPGIQTWGDTDTLRAGNCSSRECRNVCLSVPAFLILYTFMYMYAWSCSQDMGGWQAKHWLLLMHSKAWRCHCHQQLFWSSKQCFTGYRQPNFVVMHWFCPSYFGARPWMSNMHHF